MNAPLNPNKASWEKGDFTRIAESMRESGEALIHRVGISNGLKVLDLGCGDGTTAIPAAKLGAEVLGVDIASNLVPAGNKRAKDLGLVLDPSFHLLRSFEVVVRPRNYSISAPRYHAVLQIEGQQPSGAAKT
jgi:2-polyprenyl-3-methyl-5-hydroxy-6-metoxy-1,4-benzoquinol methylase